MIRSDVRAGNPLSPANARRFRAGRAWILAATAHVALAQDHASHDGHADLGLAEQIQGIPKMASEHATMTHSALPPATGIFQRSLPLPDEESEERFNRGRNVLNKVWVIAPSADTLHDGLGPLFNQRSCIACHPDNGRGQVTDALVRLSVRDHGKAVSHPIYGEQLNEQGIPGVPGEGRAELHYSFRDIKLSDGATIELREPHIEFRELHYGPLGAGTLTSLRIAPPIFGLGLLELVPESAILEYADPEDTNHDGLSGRPNLIRDERWKRTVVGRFGWKAGSPDLVAQAASAFREDMGLTTLLLPEPNCTRAETACLQAPSGGDAEVSQFMMENLVTYLMHVAPPDPRSAQGAEIFLATGCAACHRETLTTGESPRYPELSLRNFHPYTDLLLHDMGAGLADGRPDHEASGREWRTAPLWGIGHAQDVDANARFLHDGRARAIIEAILWHDGEARRARERFRALNAADRASLLAFVNSL